MQGAGCRYHVPAWGYNSVTKRCENFIYGGCQGNENRFLTEEACQQNCHEPGERKLLRDRILRNN